MKKTFQVSICGGTHGNELTGIHLLQRWQQNPDEISRTGLSVDTLLANPAAHKANRRYLDSDLNRCFSLQDLNNPALNNAEQRLAKQINQRLGPKSKPRTDFIFDLHTTTANMGLTLVLRSLDPLVVNTAIYIAQQCPDATLFNEGCRRDEDNFLVSLGGSGGLLIEVGACPQGLLRADIFEQTRKAVNAGLDYLSLHQQGTAPTLPSEMPGLSFVKKLLFPQDENHKIIGMIHPTLQDGDYRELKKGMPLFMLQTGETIDYHGEEGLVPGFLNEAAYYETGVAMTLLRRVTITAIT